MHKVCCIVSDYLRRCRSSHPTSSELLSSLLALRVTFRPFSLVYIKPEWLTERTLRLSISYWFDSMASPVPIKFPSPNNTLGAVYIGGPSLFLPVLVRTVLILHRVYLCCHVGFTTDLRMVYCAQTIGYRSLFAITSIQSIQYIKRFPDDRPILKAIVSGLRAG